MIVTITGAYRNLGDHLIGYRARQLLEKYIDNDIVNIDRSHITVGDYEIFNKANAIFLCGGPAYQKNMYPKIYPINFNKIKTPIVPFGLGWKGGLDEDIENFFFSDQSLDFIKNVHSKIQCSSARDYLTENVLRKNGIENVMMTGCPAWYDLDKIDINYKHIYEENIKTIIFSSPANVDSNMYKVIKAISTRFPNTRKICAMHHGYFVSKNMKTIKKSIGFIKTAMYAKKFGYEVLDLSSNLSHINIYKKSDLHIGYRVHAHIFMLSQRKASFLIAEDSRGLGQSEALKTKSLSADDDELIIKLKNTLDSHFNSNGVEIQSSVLEIRKKFSVMKEFLRNLDIKKI